MYCNQCGSKVDDNASICPRCGYRLPLSFEPLAQEPDAPVLPHKETGAMPPPEQVEAGDRVIELQAESSPPEESAEPEPRTRGCGWAILAGMLAGCAILIILAVGLLAVYQGMQERARLNRDAAAEHYQKGLQQLAAENYELARAEFEWALRLDPRNRDAEAKLSEVQILLSRQPTPTSALRHETAVLLYNEARALYNQGDWEGVISRLEQMRALEPDYEEEQVTALLLEAYYKAGLRLVSENRLQEAIRYFDRALQIRPGEQTIRDEKRYASLYLAGLGYWGANWQGAIDTFSALYELKPDYKDTRQRLRAAHISLGDLLATKKQWCEARDQYDRALILELSEELRAKRDEAERQCTLASLPTATPPPSGTFVGQVIKTEDVGLPTAMMIRGRVLSADGKPLQDVRVGLSAWDWSAVPAVTDGAGAFAFDGLGNPVTYTVSLLDLPALPLEVKADWSKLVWVEFRPHP